MERIGSARETILKAENQFVRTVDTCKLGVILRLNQRFLTIAIALQGSFPLGVLANLKTPTTLD